MTGRIQANNFDSWLYTAQAGPARNADLYLIIRVFLERVDPTGRGEVPDVDGRLVPIQAWGPLWAPWRAGFKQSVESVWNNRLWLVPDGYWGPACRVVIPNVKCSLDVRLVDSGWNGHLTIRCYRPVNNPFRSSMRSAINVPVLRSIDGLVRRFRAVGEMVLRDGLAPQDGGQVVTAHEIGHWLGLSHVVCDGNESRCYGQTPGQQEDVMGMGNRVNPWHAGPWAQRLRNHLDVEARGVRWRAVTERPVPRPRPPESPRFSPLTRDAGV